MGDNEQNYDDYDFGDVAPKPEYMGPDYSRPVMHPDNNYNPYGGGQPTPSLPLPAPPPGQGKGVKVKEKVSKAVKLFWIPQDIPFNSVANENVTAFSKPVDFDVWVLGAWTNSEDATVLLNQTNEGIELSVENVPIQALAGLTNQIQPVRWWKPPTFLPAQSVLKGNFINIGAEAASKLNYLTLIRGTETPVKVKRSGRFYLDLPLSSASLIGYTSPILDPLLIWGATASEGAAATLIQFTDERANYARSSQALTMPCFAGIQNNTQPVIHYPRPYLLMPRARIRGNFDIAIANGHVTFLCERLYDYDFLPQHQQHQPAQGLTDQQKQAALQRQREFQARQEYLEKMNRQRPGNRFK